MTGSPYTRRLILYPSVFHDSELSPHADAVARRLGALMYVSCGHGGYFFFGEGMEVGDVRVKSVYGQIRRVNTTRIHEAPPRGSPRMDGKSRIRTYTYRAHPVLSWERDHIRYGHHIEGSVIVG